MKKTIVCFICPNSCALSVTEDGGGIQVENNRCGRGVEFAAKELRDPERTLTSAVRISGGVIPLISVRSDGFVKKAELKNLVKELDGMTVQAPVQRGQVLCPAMGANKVNIIATKTVERLEKSSGGF
jgi:CxxC motif-containing protein